MIRLLHRRWRHRQGRGSCLERQRSLCPLVLDVDGVLADGGLGPTETGEVLKPVDVRDGLGIRLLQQAGLEVAWLSGGRSGVTEQRARDPGIRHVLTGLVDKPAALSKLQDQLGVTVAKRATVADDLNDLAVRLAIGLLLCPADAVVPLRCRADRVLDRNGGDGAVRRLAEEILQARGEWQGPVGRGWHDHDA